MTIHSQPQRPVGDDLVSIVIPTYNRSGLLRETLASVEAQTYPNLEVIVIDDGSEDDTTKSMAAWANTQSSPSIVIYERQDNAGACAARNRGASLATGTFLKFLDSDDLLAPDCIELQVRAAVERDLDMVGGRWTRFSESDSGERVSRPGWPECREPDLITRLLLSWNPPFSYLYRRSALANVEWDTSFTLYDDVDFALQAALKAPSFHSLAATVGTRRVHSERLSNAGVQAWAEAGHRVLAKLEESLAAEDSWSPTRRQAAANHRWTLARSLYDVDRQAYQAVVTEIQELCPDFRPPQRHLGFLVALLGLQKTDAILAPVRRLRRRFNVLR